MIADWEEGSGRSQSAARPISRWELAAYGALLAYFAARVVFLAIRLHTFVPPDEVTHMGRVLAYAGTWGVPDEGPSTYEYGLVGHRPWLYYWLMARVLALNVFAMADVVFLRLANGVLGVATVVVAIQWMRAWCDIPLARILFVVFVTNTLMFTGLTGSVSYDNGANLLAACTIYWFTRFRQGRDPAALLLFFASMLAGCLVKRTLLPLGFLFAALLVVRERHELRDLPRRAAELLRAGRPRTLALIATVVVLLGLVGSLYGGNLVRYGKLRPGFEQVVGQADAMKNRVHARSQILQRFRDGDIGIGEARRLASGIRHQGDRNDTLFLLKAAQLPESSLIGPVPYVWQWSIRMLGSAVGYVGHRHRAKSPTARAGYVAIFLMAGLLLARRWRPGHRAGVPADALVLVLGYALILMWLVNYPTYRTFRYIELALQGRYLFPVLVPIYGLVAYYLVSPLPERVRPWVAGAVGGFYVYGDLPWLLPQLDERWFLPF